MDSEATHDTIEQLGLTWPRDPIRRPSVVAGPDVTTEPGRVLLLVGAGHAHLHVVGHAAELIAAGCRVRLLAPRTFHYSGMASAAATGHLSTGRERIDVALLTASRGVEHHDGVLTDIDLDARVAVADDGTELPFDVISFNVGSVVTASSMVVDSAVLRVKPLSSLCRLPDRLRDRGRAGGARVSVVGGGSSGLELAAHLALRPDVAQVHLLHAGPHVGPGLPQGASRRLARLLTTRGVAIHTGCTVVRLTDTFAWCSDGTEVVHDLAVLASGLAAPPLLATLGLGDSDGIPVKATLQHPDHENVYAAGDCAHFLPHPLPRIGVHGVRQGPVLHASLLARASSGPLPVYTPQNRALSVLDLGGGIGLAARGERWWLGRSALLLKRWIDHRWLGQYRD